MLNGGVRSPSYGPRTGREGMGRGERHAWSLNSVMGGHAQGLGTGISQTVIMDRAVGKFFLALYM